MRNWVSNVEVNKGRLNAITTQQIHRLLTELHRPIRHDDPRAFAAEGHRDCAPDARTRTGN